LHLSVAPITDRNRQGQLTEFEKETSPMAASKRPRLITAAALGAVMLRVLAAPVQGVRIPEGGIVPPDSTFVIHFQLHEGCDGSPTDTLEVSIPASVENPIPEAVPGWLVETETATTEGQEGVDAEPPISLVRWTGGPLEDGQLLEFGLRLRFPDEPGATLEFPVVQRCGELEQAWTGADEAFPIPTVVLAERLSERDLIALDASLAELVTEVKDLQAQVGDVDAANLRARVTDSESATAEMLKRLDRLAERLSVLEEAAQG
jgi:uncharacterized protein YcnI